jgi:hypothetical protein
LHAAYQPINRESLGRSSPDVEIRWDDFTDERGETRLDCDEAASSKIDRGTNLTEPDLIETTRSRNVPVSAGSAANDHGLAFQICVHRFDTH